MNLKYQGQKTKKHCCWKNKACVRNWAGSWGCALQISLPGRTTMIPQLLPLCSQLLTHWNGRSVRGMWPFNVSSKNVMKRHRVPSMLPCIWQHGNGEPCHIPYMGERSHLIRWWIYFYWSMNFPICPSRSPPIPVDSLSHHFLRNEPSHSLRRL